MKFQITEIITRPEPATAPFVTLYLALTASAALAAAVAALLKGVL